MLGETWQFKTEGYYKNFSNVIVPVKISTEGLTAVQIGSNPRSRESWQISEGIYDSLTNSPSNGAKGNAYGIEFMLEK